MKLINDKSTDHSQTWLDSREVELNIAVLFFIEFKLLKFITVLISDYLTPNLKMDILKDIDLSKVLQSTSTYCGKLCLNLSPIPTPSWFRSNAKFYLRFVNNLSNVPKLFKEFAENCIFLHYMKAKNERRIIQSIHIKTWKFQFYERSLFKINLMRWTKSNQVRFWLARTAVSQARLSLPCHL